ARPSAPPSSPISASTVGLPRESSTSRAWIQTISVMSRTLHQTSCYDARMLRPVVAAFVVALMMTTAGCGSGSKCSAGATLARPLADAEVTDVLRAVEQWRQASEQRSVNALFALYDHGKQTTLVTQGQSIVGWDAV